MQLPAIQRRAGGRWGMNMRTNRQINGSLSFRGEEGRSCVTIETPFNTLHNVLHKILIKLYYCIPLLKKESTVVYKGENKNLHMRCYLISNFFCTATHHQNNF